MQIRFTHGFQKQYRKAPPQIQHAFDQRLRLLSKNPQDDVLNTHPLKGRLKGYYSMNITGDWRAQFLLLDHNTTALFVAMGTHSQLYG